MFDAKDPNASKINITFTKHITNALIEAKEERLKLEGSIPRKLQDGWEPIMTHKCRGSIVDFSISNSFEPNEEQKVLINNSE